MPDHELLRRIGAGSYGEVWLARSVMGTYRAVKVVYRNRFEHERPYEREFNGIKRFEPISRTHVGLMDILQVGRNDDEQYFYYVMEVADDEAAGQNFDPELYEAKTLRNAIANRQFKSFGECLDLCLSLTSALGHLHEHDLVHRDIKPANIIFVNGVPKLADIGLVTEIGSDSIAGGTMGYLAPEGVASPRADIYGLGKVFYEVMTGKDRLEFPELPEHWGDATDNDKFLELNAVVLKACEANPASRYQSAEELRADLVLLQTGKSVRRLRTLERRLSLLTRIGVGVAALGLLAGAAYYQIYRENVVTTRQLAGSYIAYGTRTMDGGDLLGSLPWLAKAMSLGKRTAAEEKTDRVRIAAVLQQSPMIHRIWFHDTMVQHAEFSPDGRHVLTTCHDGSVRLWHVAKDVLTMQFVGHTGEVESAAFSPDGRYVVTGGADKSARLWEAATGRQLLVLQHPQTVRSVAFDSRGERIVTGCADGRVRVWNASPQASPPAPVAEFRAQSESVLHAVFSPDGTRIAAGGTDGTAKVWDWSGTARVQGEPVRHRSGDWVYYVSFSPDGRHFATASSDSAVNICEADTGKIVLTLEHVVPVRSVEWSHDGKHLVAACTDFMARVWKFPSGKPVTPPLKHNSYLLHASFSPDDSQIVTATTGGLCCVWDLTPAKGSPQPLRETLAEASAATLAMTNASVATEVQSSARAEVDEVVETQLNADGTRAISLNCHGPVSSDWERRDPSPATAQLWETSNWRPLAPAFECTNTSWTSAISKDGHRLATLSRPDTAEVWDALAGRLLAIITAPGKIRKLLLDPGGEKVVTFVKDDPQAQVWSASNGVPLFVLQHDRTASSGAFSPDGRTLATISGSDVFLRDAATGNSRTALPHESRVEDVAFSADSQRIVSSCSDDSLAECEAQVWDVQSGHKIGAPMRHRDGVSRAELSADGQQVVTASQDFTAQVWSSATGLPLGQLLRHGHNVFWAAFSGDGRWVATASYDITVRVWDSATGEPVTPPLRQAWPPRSVQFLPDGHRLLIKRRSNGDSRLWSLPSDPRPVKDLVALSELLSGHRIDRSGGAQPLTKDALRQAWEMVRTAAPGQIKDRPTNPAR